MNAGIEESFTCEWDSKTLSCPAGQGIIIDFANYGRGVRNSKESRTLARESILESQIRIKNH